MSVLLGKNYGSQNDAQSKTSQNFAGKEAQATSPEEELQEIKNLAEKLFNYLEGKNGVVEGEKEKFIKPFMQLKQLAVGSVGIKILRPQLVEGLRPELAQDIKNIKSGNISGEIVLETFCNAVNTVVAKEMEKTNQQKSAEKKENDVADSSKKPTSDLRQKFSFFNLFSKGKTTDAENSRGSRS